MGEGRCFVQIYKTIKKIPKGRVATYGQIARIMQNSQVRITPRLVGMALHKNPDPKNIPCHRVVDRNGKVAENYAFGEWRVQKKKLEEEGVGFKNGLHVDLEKYLWKNPKL